MLIDTTLAHTKSRIWRYDVLAQINLIIIPNNYDTKRH